MRIRNALIPTVVASLALGFTAGPASDTVALSDAAPGGALVTNPIGTMRWLPAVANEGSAFGSDRIVVVYDGSLDPTTGETTELLADGEFGMKLFSNSVTDSSGREPPAIRLVDHSPWVATLEGQGAPAGTDAAFAGMSGDVRDGACANLEAEDPAGTLSYAYSFTFTVAGEAAAEACQLVDGHERDADNNILSTTITEFVPGFWFDVRWPTETDPAGAGGQGHTLSEVWYGAITGFSSSDPTAFAEAGESGNSETIRSKSDVFHVEMLQDAEPNPTLLEACPTTGHTVQVEIPTPPPGVNLVNVDLYPMGDWDLMVTDAAGSESTSGNFIVNERVQIVAEAGTIEVEGCNFAGGPFAELRVGWAN